MPHNHKKSPITQAVKLDMIGTFSIFVVDCWMLFVQRTVTILAFLTGVRQRNQRFLTYHLILQCGKCNFIFDTCIIVENVEK